MKAALILALLIVSLAAAHALGIGKEGLGLGRMGAGAKPAIIVAQPTGKILLADGVSHLLLADGVSRLCRAGGC
jgi:hypothetical protein